VPSLLVAVSIPLVLGMIDGIVSSPGPWYLTLKKPWWNPPGFLFGLAWSVLYPIMGLASWLVWADGGFDKQGYPLTLYGVQLALNLAWPVLFFRSHAIVVALFDILALVVAVVMTVSAFQPVNHVAANLLKPYLVWVTFAAALNLSILLKNRGNY
jgi:benzodiazapine receptor